MNRHLLAPAFLLLLLVQVLPAATLAWQHQQRLTDGRPVLLAVETRDPRDLLRGEYSVLAYEIGRLQGVPVSTAGLDRVCDLVRRESCVLESGRIVYVRLAPDADGVHRLVDVQLERPGAGDLVLAGTLRGGTVARTGAHTGNGAACERPVCLSGQVSYGIETWFGPQGRPAKLDAARRGDVLVEVRVDAEGTAVLDAVRVGGTVFARTARLW